jgi:putative ABC transport system permease protein
VCGLIIALPLGILGAVGMASFMSSQLNFDMSDFAIPLWVLVLESVAALLLPLLVALPAIYTATRVSVREALQGNRSSHSTTSHNFLTRSIARIEGLPRPFALALRNTFRHPGRLLRTLGVLTLGGSVFISVLTVRESLYYSLDKSISSKQYDIEMQFAHPYRTDRIVEGVQSLPGVAQVEGWGRTRAYPMRPDGSEADSITLFAPPADSSLLNLEMERGRWLHADDDRAIVLSSNYLTKEPQTRVGDELVLKIDGEEHIWHVVGVTREFKSSVTEALAYVNYDEFARVVGQAGEINSVHVVTERHDTAFHLQTTGLLEAYAEQNNIEVLFVESTSERRAMLGERFNVLTELLLVMAILIAVVGGLGLMGTMSINVIERTREIGILRAVGASDGMVQRIVITESVIIAAIAWVLATVFSVPISLMMSAQIGIGLVDHPLDYTYAFSAVAIWLVIILVVAVLASSLPACSASRLTIREVLTHE